MSITNEQVAEAYETARKLYAHEISLSAAKVSVAKKTGMNEGSAQGYVHTFMKMMEGANYTRTINAFATDYYLKQIYSDYGLEALLTAISSVKKHLEYYEGVGKSSQPTIHKILSQHIEKANKLSHLELIQKNFEKQVILSLKDGCEIRKSRLKAAEKKPKECEVTVKIFYRNPDVVAETLYRANGSCEKCMKPAPFKKAKDNSPYLEVHHIKQLSDDGLDVVENTLALCPNCHRELHYGV